MDDSPSIYALESKNSNSWNSTTALWAVKKKFDLSDEVIG